MLKFLWGTRREYLLMTLHYRVFLGMTITLWNLWGGVTDNSSDDREIDMVNYTNLSNYEIVGLIVYDREGEKIDRPVNRPVNKPIVPKPAPKPQGGIGNIYSRPEAY